ncbi:MAG: nuclear transport factor 2 family protein [Lysobacteraceae bacterium]
MRSVLNCLALLVCLAASPLAMADEEGSALATAKQLLDAFNRHDPAAMAALVADDFELFYVDESGKAALGAKGPDDLRTQMTGYFASRPTVRSVIEGSVDGPRFASFRERAISIRDGMQRSASSLAVYEVVDGKVLRVWYYPAEAPRSEPVDGEEAAAAE